MSASQPALLTCIVTEQHKVVYEIDKYASCNILLLADYIKAIGDKQNLPEPISRYTSTPVQFQ